MSRYDIEARNGDITLTGSVWTPEDQTPIALVLMHPGSGPSDRDNDVFFPPIRDTLLAAGVAVTSFDKRGVGGSGGDWLEAGIEAQAADLVASLEVAKSSVPGTPIGLFGHSQGGWVVLEAALQVPVDFVITSSGPGVTPRVQEEFSTRNSLVRTGFGDAEVEDILRVYGELCDRMTAREGFGEVEAWMRSSERASAFAALEHAGAFVPDDEGLWQFATRVIDHDPAPALAALRVPLLALLGGADNVVPVERSAEVFRREVRPELLTLNVVEGGDHRMQFPGTEDFVPGYFPALIEYVTALSR